MTYIYLDIIANDGWWNPAWLFLSKGTQSFIFSDTWTSQSQVTLDISWPISWPLTPLGGQPITSSRDRACAVGITWRSRRRITSSPQAVSGLLLSRDKYRRALFRLWRNTRPRDYITWVLSRRTKLEDLYFGRAPDSLARHARVPGSSPADLAWVLQRNILASPFSMWLGDNVNGGLF